MHVVQPAVLFCSQCCYLLHCFAGPLPLRPHPSLSPVNGKHEHMALSPMLHCPSTYIHVLLMLLQVAHQAPGYYTIIADPQDLSTIKNRLDDDEKTQAGDAGGAIGSYSCLRELCSGHACCAMHTTSCVQPASPMHGERDYMGP